MKLFMNERNHKISQCVMLIGFIGNLKKHIEAVHEGKKPHKCVICEATFTQKTSLKKHITNVHEKVN